jgi:hypothetical protein
MHVTSQTKAADYSIDPQINPPADSARPVPKPDPWDLDSIRAQPEDYGEISTRTVLTQIKIQKPDRQTFIRVHPDPTYRVDVPVVIFKEEGEFYLVRSRQAKEALSGETCVIALFLCVTLQGTPFLWPIPKQRADDLKWNPWHESAYDLATGVATESWVRVLSNREKAGGYYFAKVAEGILPEPKWPDMDFLEILHKAFRQPNVVDDVEHAIIKRLSGRKF